MFIKFKSNIKLTKDFLKTKRCLIDKDITKFNILSRILFYFLICQTFEKAKAHHKWGRHSIDIFANCQEFRGTYSYCEIAEEFGLTNTLKKFAYVNRVMRREPHNKFYLLVLKLKETAFRYITTIKLEGRAFKRPYETTNLKNI